MSDLKANEAKCKIAGIGVLRVVSVALCGTDCIELTEKTTKNLEINFSYNKNLKQKKTLWDMFGK